MKSLEPISFRDADCGEEATAVLHAERERVAIRFSLNEDEREVVVNLTPSECGTLLRALQEAQSDDRKSTKTIEFLDGTSGDEAIVIVRALEGLVGVGLSLKKDGDIELVFPPAEAGALAETVAAALSIAETPGNTDRQS
jgi:hypothetical protein